MKRRIAAVLLFLAVALVGVGCSTTSEEGNKQEEAKFTFEATVLKVEDGALLVEPAQGTAERASADRIVLDISNITEQATTEYLEQAAPGNAIEVTYGGEIAESYPAHIQQVVQLRPIKSGLASGTEGAEQAVPEQLPPPKGETALYVTDTAMYRGKITDIKDNQWRVEQVPGRDYGYDALLFSIEESTCSQISWEEYAVGDYIEVFYSTVADGCAEAIAINQWGDADMVVYNGEVLEKQEQEGKISLVLTPIEEPVGTAVFHIGEETKVYVEKEQLQPGTKLSILYNGIMTRSLPPQATAGEIALYQLPETTEKQGEN